MSKKEQLNKKEKKFEHLIEELMPKRLAEQTMHEYCDLIQRNVAAGEDDNIIINFTKNRQMMDEEEYVINGDVVVKIQRVYADETDWIYIKENEKLDAVAHIGGFANKPRVFWQCKLEENGSDHISELESIYVAAISNNCLIDFENCQEVNNCKNCNKGNYYEYAILTYFNNGKISIRVVEDKSDFEAVKSLISEIAAEKKVINSFPPSGKDNDLGIEEEVKNY